VRNAIVRLAVAAAAIGVCGAGPFALPSASAAQEPAAAARQGAPDPRYPAHWWAAVPKEGAPAWEILPQAAGPGDVIVSKRHELGLLSNFAATPFVFHGTRYASVEGFWQMMLYPEGPGDPRARFPGLSWPHSREQVSQMVGFDAKGAGAAAEQNMTRMGIDWVSFEGERFPYRPDRPGRHYELVVAAMREKVRQNPAVQRVLLATGDLVLKPDHYEEAGAKAAWHYCDILMQIRAEHRRRYFSIAHRGTRPGVHGAPIASSRSARPFIRTSTIARSCSSTGANAAAATSYERRCVSVGADVVAQWPATMPWTRSTIDGGVGSL
jgi:predicted NAD-dependent protein-ADP-ribosyltransferase YbiA (DUF1768 family)